MFVSSLRDKPHEKEIPEAMIALVCAVVCLYLSFNCRKLTVELGSPRTR